MFLVCVVSSRDLTDECGRVMDNASFIASLDPLLREEVLMTAPESMGKHNGFLLRGR